MKAIIEFDLDDIDDKDSHQTMMQAQDMKLCLWDISQEFRKICKYTPDDMTEAELKGWEDAREMFLNMLGEYNIQID